MDSHPVSDVMAAFRRVHTRSNRDINNENEDTENAIYCNAEFAVSSLAVAGPSPVLIARPGGWLNYKIVYNLSLPANGHRSNIK